MKEDITKTFIDEIKSKPPHKIYETNKTMIKSIDNNWSSDLWDINDYSPKKTRGCGYNLVEIDKFSKFDLTIPSRNKYAQSITNAFPQMVKTPKHKPIVLETDDDKKYVR